MKICEIKGCERKSVAKKLCIAHYKKQHYKMHPELKRKAIENYRKWCRNNLDKIVHYKIKKQIEKFQEGKLFYNTKIHEPRPAMCDTMKYRKGRYEREMRKWIGFYMRNEKKKNEKELMKRREEARMKININYES